MKVNDFDLKSTVTCGQIFRYDIEFDDSYTIVLKDRIVNLKQIDNELIIESNNMDDINSIVNEYLDLNRDYNEMNNRIISYCNNVKELIDESKGLKMIKQDPFITIISFIISANNSVSSIRNSLNLIALKYGKEVKFKNKKYYLFPSFEELKSVSIKDYRDCKVGFRDKYLYNIVQCLNNNELNLDKISNLNSDEALKLLITYPGIGPKVASCILLFGYQQFDVFPIDTWVKKYMLDKYNIKGEKNIREFITDTYKEYSAIVIQYMFNYKRNSIVKK